MRRARCRGESCLLAGLLAALALPSGRAGTITGSLVPIAAGSNVDLTIAGKLDWVHWGAETDSSLTRKSGVPPLISDYVVLGTGVVYPYQYSDNVNGYTWYDGVPLVEMTNTTTGVWAYQAYPPELPGSGFQITAPADTTPKTLQVFVGTFAARGQLQATLSDGGLPYTDTSLFNSANGPGGAYVLEYKANSPGQVLTVKWTLYQRAAGTNSITGNVTLQAATLTATNANNPPFTRIIAPTDPGVFTAPTNIELQATAEDYDGTVTNVGFYLGQTPLDQLVSPPYRYLWSNPPVGRYSLTSKAHDEGGAFRVSTPVEVFVCTNDGLLNAEVQNSPATVDLTTEGTLDWVHWGLITNTSVDRKSGVTPIIPNFNVLGTNLLQRYADNFTTFVWSDGSPTPSTNGTPTGVFVSRLGSGFKLTLPADTSTRSARFYVGGYGVQARFEAYLSDLSANPFVDRSVSNVFDNSYVVYTLNYAAASSDQTLSVTYSAESLFDLDYGNVTWQAVTLQGPPLSIPPIPLTITNIGWVSNSFVLRFASLTNHAYTVQYTEDLYPAWWSNLVTLPGDGGLLSITNEATASRRFYRVKLQ